MKPAHLRILAFAAVASLPLMAQQPSPSSQPAPGNPQVTPPTQTNPEPGASETGPGQASPGKVSPVPSTANSPEVATPQLRPVTGELESKLDTKDAKAGDAVVVKTTASATTADGMEIPKGSKITGHIIDVAPQGQQGSENSRVTIQFDQAQLQGGKNLPIRSVIQSVAPPGAASGPDTAGGPPAPPSPSGVTSGGNSPASGASAATAPSGASGAAQGSAPAPGTVVATRGNLAIKTTSIPGVLLIGDVNGRPFSNASGALLGAKRDVQLENGTVMVVAIMAAPQQGPAGH